MSDKEASRKVPQWVVDYITEWKARLLLHEWETQTSINAVPAEDGDATALACVSIFPDSVLARIKIRDDVPDDLSQVDELTAEKWQKTIIHELFHIRIGRLTHLIDQEILSDYSARHRQLLERAFQRELEPAVEIMAHVLYTLAQDAALSRPVLIERSTPEDANGRTADNPPDQPLS